MIQKKYKFHTLDDLKPIVTAISECPEYKNASGVLLQLYNPKIDADDDSIVEYINSNLNNACLIGLTCANIADEEYDIKDDPIELNATFFKTTKLIEMDFDMQYATGFVAGRIINEQLDNFPNARCMQVCYSCSSATIFSFTEEFRHHNLPMFGAKSGRSIRALNTSKVYGKRASADGIVAIIFEGPDLHLYLDNCLGFKEIGAEMKITQLVSDNVVATVDNKPATDIYAKYLKVKPNKFFVENVCEFPMIFRRNNCPVARVPAGYMDDGSIVLTTDVSKGEVFRLSYGNPDTLIYIVKKSLKNMKKFNPEAVFLFECGNRVRFLKDQAYLDTSEFLEYAPNASISIGYAEMFFSNSGDGGALNSALVTVGLTEDPEATDVIRPHIDFSNEEETVTDDDAYIPFVDRILNFLETTSEELEAKNKELGKIAYTDQLTKIYNRWELENKLEVILQESKLDASHPASLLFMDIDHFKGVNDTYGHDVGDIILKESVNIIKDNLKSDHVFGRWGGEEFIYILPDTDSVKASEFAESLRKQIEEYSFTVVGHITMSFGVTRTRSDDTTESFLKRADDGLYKAKETGRNKVVILE